MARRALCKGQMTLSLFDSVKPVDEWELDDLMSWASPLGRLKAHGDKVFVEDLLPPICVTIETKRSRKGAVKKSLTMCPVDINDWNRGCPGCSSNDPEWVMNFIRNHTGENFKGAYAFDDGEDE